MGGSFLQHIRKYSFSPPAKVPRVVQDPLGELRAEAEEHAKAWSELDHVLPPIGLLSTHDQTGSPAVLLMEIAM